jgi:hypothetical protein
VPVVEVSVEAIQEAMSRIERMLGAAESFDDTVAAIDACAAMPGAAPTYLPSLYRYRLMAMDIHGRSDAEVCAAIDALMASETPLLYRALSVSAACANRASVAARYLPSLTRELHAAMGEAPGAATTAVTDEALAQTLRDVQAVCERLGVDCEE